MNKAGAHKTGEASETTAEPVEPGAEGAIAAEFAIHEYIGRQLKLMFDEVAGEPVPKRIVELLEQLERKETKR
jgi:hypothetical protein